MKKHIRVKRRYLVLLAGVFMTPIFAVAQITSPSYKIDSPQYLPSVNNASSSNYIARSISTQTASGQSTSSSYQVRVGSALLSAPGTPVVVPGVTPVSTSSGGGSIITVLTPVTQSPHRSGQGVAVQNVFVSRITSQSAVVSFDATVPVVASLLYHTGLAVEKSTLPTSMYALSHATLLAGLLPDTVYEFSIFTRTEAGESSVFTNKTYTFKTTSNARDQTDTRTPVGKDLHMPSTTPAPSATPGQSDKPNNQTQDNQNSIPDVSNFYARAGDRSVELVWKNPPFTSDDQVVVIRKKVGSFPESSSDGSEVFRGRAERAVDGEVNDQRVMYAAFVENQTTHTTSTGSFATAQPKESIKPSDTNLTPNQSPQDLEGMLPEDAKPGSGQHKEFLGLQTVLGVSVCLLLVLLIFFLLKKYKARN